MSTIHGGGTPYAAATIFPRLSSTTKDHPSLTNSGVGPSRAEPSGYTTPTTRPSRGLTYQLKVSTLDFFLSGRDGLADNPFPHEGCPLTWISFAVRTSDFRACDALRASVCLQAQLRWIRSPFGAFSSCSGMATTASLTVLGGLPLLPDSASTILLSQSKQRSCDDHPHFMTLVCGYCLLAMTDLRQPLCAAVQFSSLVLGLSARSVP